MGGLSTAQISHNNLYVCCAVITSPEYYARDGAVQLNHLLQERARLTRGQAFQVISDALHAGLVVIDKADNKRLSIVWSAFTQFRDKMIDEIGAVESEVVTMSWTMHPPSEIDEAVRAKLRKHVDCGRLVELGGTRAGRCFTAIDKLLSTVVAMGVADYVSEDVLKIIEAASELLTDAVDDVVSDDFIIVIARSGQCGVARGVTFFRSKDEETLASPESAS